MEISGISRLLLVGLLLSLGGCGSSLFGSGLFGGGTANAPVLEGVEQENAQVSQIFDLQRQLAAEGARAADAEKEAQRARAEVDWLARAAQEEPQLRARIVEQDEEIARLIADNQRIIVLEANLRQLEATNDRLSRQLRGDWGDAPGTPAPAAALGAAPAMPTAEVLPDIADYGAGNYAVHLASYRSKEASLDGWRRLQGLFPELLGALSGHFAIFDVPSLGGRFYRLKAGPFDGAAGAQQLCRSLNNAGEYCVVTVFDGEQLVD